MKQGIENLGLESIVFILIILISIMIFELSPAYSVIAGFIGVLITYLIKNGVRK